MVGLVVKYVVKEGEADAFVQELVLGELRPRAQDREAAICELVATT